MRFSTDEDDIGFAAWLIYHNRGRAVRVYLDGTEVQQCITADDEEGFVVRNVLTERGEAQLDPDNRNQVWRERVEGHVKIVIQDRPK